MPAAAGRYARVARITGGRWAGCSSRARERCRALASWCAIVVAVARFSPAVFTSDMARRYRFESDRVSKKCARLSSQTRRGFEPFFEYLTLPREGDAPELQQLCSGRTRWR